MSDAHAVLGQAGLTSHLEQHQPLHQHLPHQTSSLQPASTQASMQQPHSSIDSTALPEGHTLDMQAGSLDAGHANLSLDSTRLQGVLHQPPLDSVTVARECKHASQGPDSSSVRPSNADSQGQYRSNRKQPRPHSAAALSPDICPDATAAQAAEDEEAQDCQPGHALACSSGCYETASAMPAADVLPSAKMDARALPGGRALQRHRSSTASNMISASSKSLDAQAVEALAITESMLSSSHMQPAEASNGYLHCEGSLDSAQVASDPASGAVQDLRADPASGAVQDLRADPAQGLAEDLRVDPAQGLVQDLRADPAPEAVQDLRADAGPTGAEDRLKAILQDTSLQELAALLSSEESENESDFSEDSGSGSGDGSADGADQSGAQVSSCADQDEVAQQPEVQLPPKTATSVEL